MSNMRIFYEKPEVYVVGISAERAIMNLSNGGENLNQTNGQAFWADDED